jgi:hypothetical protein
MIISQKKKIMNYSFVLELDSDADSHDESDNENENSIKSEVMKKKMILGN